MKVKVIKGYEKSEEEIRDEISAMEDDEIIRLIYGEEKEGESENERR